MRLDSEMGTFMKYFSVRVAGCCRMSVTRTWLANVAGESESPLPYIKARTSAVRLQIASVCRESDCRGLWVKARTAAGLWIVLPNSSSCHVA